MKFGSVCSGIEAASVAFAPVGWEAAWFSEIEPFPSAVLAHHYPQVPNLGDITTLVRRILRGEVEAPDLLCGGTPCQAFSVAGKRESLDDARGNLTLTFCEIANAIDHVRAARGEQPCIVKWENVPGVLSTRDNAFGCFLGALAGSGCELQPPGGRWADAGCVYGPTRAIAWRVLDAQYFGLAQRRRRVFVVASARNGFDPAAVLFESDGVRRDSAPRREPGEIAAACLTFGAHPGGHNGQDDAKDERLIPVAFETVATLDARTRGGGFPGTDGAAGGHVVPVAFHPTQDPISSTGGTTHCMGTGSSQGTATIAVAVALRGREGGATAEVGDDCGHALRASSGGGDKPHVLTNMAVRRLTPRECERLQGFPDDYTLIPWRGKPAEQCPDGPRYKALGNSWAVPCVAWIGRRINQQLRATA